MKKQVKDIIVSIPAEILYLLFLQLYVRPRMPPCDIFQYNFEGIYHSGKLSIWRLHFDLFILFRFPEPLWCRPLRSVKRTYMTRFRTNPGPGFARFRTTCGKTYLGYPYVASWDVVSFNTALESCPSACLSFL